VYHLTLFLLLLSFFYPPRTASGRPGQARLGQAARARSGVSRFLSPVFFFYQSKLLWYGLQYVLAYYSKYTNMHGNNVHGM
jgi:hypothetical protein